MTVFDDIIRQYVVKNTDDVVEVKSLARDCPCCDKNTLSGILLESSCTYVLWCTACEVAAVGSEPMEVLRKMRHVKSNARKVEDFEEDRRRAANAEGYTEWGELVAAFHERTRMMLDLEKEVEEFKRCLAGRKEECPLIVKELKNKVYTGVFSRHLIEEGL